ncbi:MAG: nitrile hydratase accessory protein [Beijerinckiaceae bacterium]
MPSDIPELAGQGEANPATFSAPWEAQAFAMAVVLHEKGLFTWNEWAETLSAEIRQAQKLGDADNGRTYYNHWLNALEKLVIRKGVASAGLLGILKDQWDEAARNTPHGEPVLRQAPPTLAQ